MANDSGLFRTRDQLERDGWTLTGNVFVRRGLRMLPLYEAKMIHHFDSRFSTYDGATQAQINKGTLPHLTFSQHGDPLCAPMPRYWVHEADTRDDQRSTTDKPVQGVASRLKAKHWNCDWLLGWRDIARSTDQRTMICSALPRVAVGNKLPLALTDGWADLLMANLSSFVIDYVVRQKSAGSGMTYFIVKQVPALPPEAYQVPADWLVGDTPAQWIRQRVLELSFTAWDMEAFARDLGDGGAPFRWNDERRPIIRAELDAVYFHLYGLQRDEVAHIMDSFDALRRREEKPQNFGEFRTKRLILERYDAMADAIRTGEPYQTILDPPPGHGPRHAKRDVLRGDDLG
jgi:hypothetical protein